MIVIKNFNGGLRTLSNDDNENGVSITDEDSSLDNLQETTSNFNKGQEKRHNSRKTKRDNTQNILKSYIDKLKNVNIVV